MLLLIFANDLPHLITVSLQNFLFIATFKKSEKDHHLNNR